MSVAAHRLQLMDDARDDGLADLDLDFLFAQDAEARYAGTEGVAITDLFSGCGGLTYGALEGLRRAGRGGRLALAVDKEAAPVSVLRATMGRLGDRFSDADLRTTLASFDAKVTSVERELLEPHRSGGGLLLAGPPCQGHSTLNNHTRHD